MSQEVEIEFKSMLTQHEYEQLLMHYELTDHVRRQANDYFDTPNFDLKRNGAALRIRQKGDTLVLTLKQRHTVGLLETNQAIDEAKADALFKQGILLDETIRQALLDMNVEGPLNHLGRLETKRAERQLPEGLLVLDHSLYLDHEDYELEFEVTDETLGKASFEALLKHHNLPYRASKNKIVRFMERKQKNGKG